MNFIILRFYCIPNRFCCWGGSLSMLKPWSGLRQDFSPLGSVGGNLVSPPTSETLFQRILAIVMVIPKSGFTILEMWCDGTVIMFMWSLHRNLLRRWRVHVCSPIKVQFDLTKIADTSASCWPFSLHAYGYQLISCCIKILAHPQDLAVFQSRWSRSSKVSL